MIEVVSEIRLIKEGFRQAFYEADGYEILLNDIKKGTDLNRHKHSSCQFVYCFQGEFDLVVDEQRHRLEPSESLVIPSDTPHSAEAVSDFMSLDVKYCSKRKNYGVIETNVCNEKNEDGCITVKEADFEGMILKRIVSNRYSSANINLDPKKKILMVTERNLLVGTGEIEGVLSPMRIYRIYEERGPLIFKSNYADLMLFEF